MKARYDVTERDEKERIFVTVSALYTATVPKEQRNRFSDIKDKNAPNVVRLADDEPKVNTGAPKSITQPTGCTRFLRFCLPHRKAPIRDLHTLLAERQKTFAIAHCFNDDEEAEDSRYASKAGV